MGGLSIQDLSTNPLKKEQQPAAKQVTTKATTAVATNNSRLGERKNSAQAPSTQSILGGGSGGPSGEVSNGHTVGRSTGVRGSVELKSIN